MAREVCDIMASMYRLDILFVQNYYEQTLGIMQISAVLKKQGFTTDVAIGRKQDILRYVRKTSPRIVGFYCTTGFHHKNIETAVEIKKLFGEDILTIFGGPHPTFVPEMIEREGVDIICRGEGEYPVLELLQALREQRDYSRIQNLSVKRNGTVYQNDIKPLCDLDSLPPVDREIYRRYDYIYNNKRQEVLLGRGCAFDCNFCSTHAFRELYKGKGSYMRFRSIANVITELENVKKRYNPSCFFFHDEIFGLEGAYHRDFLNLYRERIGLPFTCLIRADLATEGLIKLLKKSGCYSVSFGIESGNDTLRNMLLGKKLSEEQIVRCADLLHRYVLPFATFNMVGLPGETLEQVWDTANLNVRVKPAWAWFSVYQPLPQTRLARYALDKGYILRIDVLRSDASFHENSMLLKGNPESRKILRLKNNANLLIKMPFLKLFIGKFILALPLDGIYTLLDKLLYFTFYYAKLTYKQGLLRTVRSAFFLIRRLNEFT